MILHALHGKKMKVLHISSSDTDGGAARAAYKLHKTRQESCLPFSMHCVYIALDINVGI